MYEYRAKVVRVIDGDTIECEIDLGFYVKTIQRLRLLHINAPEIKGRTKLEGEKSKEYLTNRLLNKEVIIKTNRNKSFDRWLAEVFLEENGNTINISEEMIKIGLAAPYEK